MHSIRYRVVKMALALLVIGALPACADHVPPPPYYIQVALPYGPGVALDAYVPLQAEPHAAVLLLHPGGFVGGRRQDMRALAAAFADEGFLALSMDYSLPAHYGEAMVELHDAIAYVRSHFGVGRIGLFGASAGGTIALDGAVGIRAVATWSPVLDLAHAGLLQHPANVYLDGTSPDRASPISVIGPGYPPSLIATSRHDLIPVSQAEAVAGRLGQLRIPHELLVFPAGHALQYTARALEPTIEFFHRYLGL
jgi:acetyl esterase/lipase